MSQAQAAKFIRGTRVLRRPRGGSLRSVLPAASRHRHLFTFLSIYSESAVNLQIYLVRSLEPKPKTCPRPATTTRHPWPSESFEHQMRQVPIPPRHASILRSWRPAWHRRTLSCRTIAGDWDFPKIRVSSVGLLIIRILLSRVLY